MGHTLYLCSSSIMVVCSRLRGFIISSLLRWAAHSTMSDTNHNFSCPNPLCDSNELFSDYDAVCKHLSIPSTHCSQWAIDFVDRMTHANQHSNENENDG